MIMTAGPKQGLDGWSYKEVLPYFVKSETYHGAPSPWHGENGPLQVTDSPADNPLHHAFLRACEESGLQRNPDFNGASLSGCGVYQRTIHNGARCSALHGLSSSGAGSSEQSAGDFLRHGVPGSSWSKTRRAASNLSMNRAACRKLYLRIARSSSARALSQSPQLLMPVRFWASG